MRNRPLAVQIWLVFGATLAVLLVLATLAPLVFHNLFNPEIHSTIENVQDIILRRGRPAGGETPLFPEEQRPNFRLVHNLNLGPDGVPLQPADLSADLLAQVKAQALSQEASRQRYTGRLPSGRVYYVITRIQDGGFMFSYMLDIYRDRLMRSLFRRLVSATALIFLLGWIPSLLLARYLARPLVTLEQHVKRIAGQDWHSPVHLARKDEIGLLAESIETMRQQLIDQDETRQAFLQQVSHELKTPVMVIRSYARSIDDGIFPRDDLPGSVRVIEQEAERLEKKVNSLLYLTKLDYLTSRRPEHVPVELDTLTEEVAARLRFRRPELAWSLDLDPVTVSGDREQLAVALENLLDNQLRYAATHISVSLDRPGKEGDPAVLRVFNDGPPLEPEDRERLFEPFHKGRKGEFGLGLTVVRRVARLHGADTYAENVAGGVAFYLKIPLV